MDLSLNEAATLLGRSPRTLRDQLTRGDVAGFKRGGRWFLRSDALPLTAAQRATLQARADEIRGLVDEALPPTPARTERGRSLAEVTAFSAAWPVLSALQAAVARGDTHLGPAADELHAALLALAEGNAAFHRDQKLSGLGRARAGLARAVARLLLAAPPPLQEPVASQVRALEEQALPALAGLIRWTERLGRGGAARD